RVAAGHRRAVPAERLRQRRARDEARVAVADRLAADHQLDVAPAEPGVGQGGARGDHAVLDEGFSPRSPGVHADAGDGDRVRAAHACTSPEDALYSASFVERPSCGSAGRQFQTLSSTPAEETRVPGVTSMIIPTRSVSAGTSGATCPSTVIRSVVSSTAARA